MIKGLLIYVFVRLKPSEHCLLVNLKTNGKLKYEKTNFIHNHTWLI